MSPDCPEGPFEDAVIDLAHTHGWIIHAERPAKIAPDPATGRTRARTHIKGDRGYPDITATHPNHGIVLAELKAAKGTLGPGQPAWINTLANHDRPGSPVLIEIWRPADWDAIQTCFRYGIHYYRAHHRR